MPDANALQYEVYEVSANRELPDGSTEQTRIPLGRFPDIIKANLFCEVLRDEARGCGETECIHWVRALRVIPQRTATHIFDVYKHRKDAPREPTLAEQIRQRAGVA